MGKIKDAVCYDAPSDHDPLCPQGGGASITTTEGLGDFPCLCDLIAKVREDTIAKCIAAVDELQSDMANWSSDETRAATDVVPDLTADKWIWAQRGVGRSIQILRSLQEKP